jgi:DNA-binding beta-propeller fold protein YncE
VTDKERSVVVRIDPATNSVVDSFRAGPGAFAMARVGDSVWVTSFAGSDMHRFDS